MGHFFHTTVPLMSLAQVNISQGYLNRNINFDDEKSFIESFSLWKDFSVTLDLKDLWYFEELISIVPSYWKFIITGGFPTKIIKDKDNNEIKFATQEEINKYVSLMMNIKIEGIYYFNIIEDNFLKFIAEIIKLYNTKDNLRYLELVWKTMSEWCRILNKCITNQSKRSVSSIVRVQKIILWFEKELENFQNFQTSFQRLKS